MGRFVHVEVAPGVVTVVAAWMLDAAACVGMGIGSPQASLAVDRRVWGPRIGGEMGPSQTCKY